LSLRERERERKRERERERERERGRESIYEKELHLSMGAPRLKGFD
jgi:hypothetical protein